MTGHRSRWIEDLGAIIGVLIGAAYVVGVEIFPQACYSIGRCPNAPQAHPFPYGVLFIVTACILPKTVGRMTAGKVWESIGTKLPGVSKPDSDGTASREP